MKNTIIKDLKYIIKEIQEHKYNAHLEETRELLESISRDAETHAMETDFEEQRLDDLIAIANELMDIYKDQIRPNLRRK